MEHVVFKQSKGHMFLTCRMCKYRDYYCQSYPDSGTLWCQEHYGYRSQNHIVYKKKSASELKPTFYRIPNRLFCCWSLFCGLGAVSDDLYLEISLDILVEFGACIIDAGFLDVVHACNGDIAAVNFNSEGSDCL